MSSYETADQAGEPVLVPHKHEWLILQALQRPQGHSRSEYRPRPVLISQSILEDMSFLLIG